jgi:DNA polymerase elongation subunit (family B)
MYRNEASLPKGAIVARRRMQTDPGYLPRYKERIPYIIVNGQEASVTKKKS